MIVFLGAIGALTLAAASTTTLSLWFLGAHFDHQSEQAQLGRTELVNPDEAGEKLGAVECREREVNREYEY